MKISFRGKIYLSLLTLLLFFGGGIYVAARGIIKESMLEEHRKRGLLIAANLAVWTVEPILAMDFLRLKNLVDEAVSSNEDTFYAFILNTRGEVLVHTFTGGFPIDLLTVNSVPSGRKYNRVRLDTDQGLVHDFAVPVLVGGDSFGTVRLGLLQNSVNRAIHGLSLVMLLATVFILAFSGVIGGVLARAMGRKIESLHRSIEKVMRGDLDVQAAPAVKKTCREIMDCSRIECPAYNEPRLRCWYVAGTLCPSCVKGEYARKIESCARCQVYRKSSGDEIQNLAESFDFMVRSLKYHLQELEASRARLSDQQELLKTILNATPDFVSLQDCQSVYRVTNKAFCRIARRSEDEIIGKTDRDLFSHARAEANRQEDLHVMQSGEALTKEERIGLGENTRWIHLVKLPVRDASGAIVGLLCSGRDITDVKKFQERLIQAQKMEAVGQLTAGIAHEINTPLGVILGYSQLLLEEVEPGSQVQQDLQTIEKQAKICRKIVADLLRFSRHSESSMAPCDINKVVEDALAVVEYTFGLEHVRVERSLAPDLPPVVGDEEKLKQVLVNLLNNALDAIGANGLIIVSSSFELETNELLLSVADSGMGISPEHMEKIFNPFFTTKGVGKGTGLGLSVTFGIIKDHGGRIQVRSPLPPALAEKMAEHGINGKTSKGTVFTIHLPVVGSGVDSRKE